MDDLDREIEAALSAEDRDILAKFEEQGVISQWFAVYDGTVRGVAVLATITIVALFFAALYCGWRSFEASEPIDVARWSAGVILLMGMTGFLKLWFWLRLESNRVLREIKRLELQMARTNAR
jgi:hypothetical protein